MKNELNLIDKIMIATCIIVFFVITATFTLSVDGFVKSVLMMMIGSVFGAACVYLVLLVYFGIRK